MGMSLHVVAIEDEATAGLSADEAVVLLQGGWSAGQLGWAVPGLMFGEPGVILFGHSLPWGLGPVVQVMDPLVLEDLVRRKAEASVMRERFEAQAFGDELGPVPATDDADWLLESASGLQVVLADAYSNDKWVLFGFL